MIRCLTGDGEIGIQAFTETDGNFHISKFASTLRTQKLRIEESNPSSSACIGMNIILIPIPHNGCIRYPHPIKDFITTVQDGIKKRQYKVGKTQHELHDKGMENKIATLFLAITGAAAYIQQIVTEVLW